MKKGLIVGAAIAGVIIVFIAIMVFWGIGTYNNLVTLNESVEQSWGQVQNVYQRRADLIPNLVNTVKGYANFERGVLTDVTEARAKASQMNIDASVLNDPAAFQKFQQVQGQLDNSLSRLLVTVENYPDLKASANFQQLQVQLEGTENRISVERRKFNETVQQYNTTIKKFPSSIFAGMFGYSAKQYFKAAPGAETAPKVEF
jgi:LemA protein